MTNFLSHNMMRVGQILGNAMRIGHKCLYPPNHLDFEPSLPCDVHEALQVTLRSGHIIWNHTLQLTGEGTDHCGFRPHTSAKQTEWYWRLLLSKICWGLYIIWYFLNFLQNKNVLYFKVTCLSYALGNQNMFLVEVSNSNNTHGVICIPRLCLGHK